MARDMHLGLNMKCSKSLESRIQDCGGFVIRGSLVDGVGRISDVFEVPGDLRGLATICHALRDEPSLGLRWVFEGGKFWTP